MLVDRSLLIVGAMAALALDAGAAAPPRARYDIHGDRLPPGAIARLGKSSDAKTALGTVAFLPEGESLLSFDGRIVRRWDARTGKLLSTKTFRDPVLAVAPDGKLLFAREGKVWLGTLDGEEIRRFDSERTFDFPTFSPDGRKLVLGGLFTTLILHDVTTGKAIRRIAPTGPRDSSRFAFPLGFSHDGKRLIYTETLASRERRVQYNPITGQYIGELSIHAVHALDAVTGRDLYHLRVNFSGVKLCSVERHLVAFGEEKSNTALRLFRPTPAREVQPIILRPAKNFNEVNLSPDHRYVACRISRTEVGLCEAASGRAIRHFPQREGDPTSPSFFAYSRASMTFSPDGRRLFCHTDDHTGLLWDVTGRAIDGRLTPATPSPNELESLWRDLASADALVAHRAIWALVACPRQSVALIGRRLATPLPRSPTLSRLIGDLGSERLQTREKATSALLNIGHDAVPALERTLASRPDFEVYRRVERLLQQSDGPLTDPDRLRELRSVHILERIGTPAARTLLRRIEGQATGTRLGEEAKSALQRLARR